MTHFSYLVTFVSCFRVFLAALGTLPGCAVALCPPGGVRKQVLLQKSY